MTGFLYAPPPRSTRRSTAALSIVSIIALSVALSALPNAACETDERPEAILQTRSLLSEFDSSAKVELETEKAVEKIAFGSCSSRHVSPQAIWAEYYKTNQSTSESVRKKYGVEYMYFSVGLNSTLLCAPIFKGVIPSEPDAWIWAGDMAYIDTAMLDCTDVTGPDCECEADFLKAPPYDCKVGDIDNARKRMQRQLDLPGYRAFLDFMCPNHLDTGVFPPIGTDTEMCPRPIMGTYDDHDYGWNNGNRRLPDKQIMKQVFLDGIGEPVSSPRRTSARGIEWRHVLNPGTDKEIDVILLDERYNKDTLPCHMRKDWCEEVLESSDDVYDLAFCEDFLVSGGANGQGSCCKADDTWARGWCKEGNKDDPLYKVACDPLSDEFGTVKVSLAEDGTLTTPAEQTWNDVEEVANFCDLLGVHQRNWLPKVLKESDAPLKLVVSGSVLFGRSGYAGGSGACSGDDWECYHPAQLNMIHMLNSVTSGCVVVVTGDFHFSDIRMVKPGNDSDYSEHYMTDTLKKPLYQIMSSGMTTSLANYQFDPEPCSKWRGDELGLRVKGNCSAVFEPSFGMIEVDWDKREVTLQHRNETDGTKIATGFDGTEQTFTFSLDTCQPA